MFFKSKELKSGFTLIELLVVIAIIGILSSVVLASLNSARAKGQMAKVKEELNSARNQAALFAADGGGYAGVCQTSEMQQIVTGLSAGGDASCDSDTATTFEVWVKTVLNGPTEKWCTDETGFLGKIPGSTGTCT